MARITVRARSVLPSARRSTWRTPSVCSLTTSLANRNCAPNCHACSYARPASSSPEMPAGKPR